MARLLVTGGSGFVGRSICRQAIREGHEVRSVSQSGRPADVDVSVDGAWVEEVEWTSADLFSPHTWRDRLRGCGAVIHSVGIAHESPETGETFERINGDSAIIAALEAERAGVETFVFLSSAANYPTARREYIRSKRRAERAIADLNVELTVLRPGPVYGPGQPHFPAILNELCRVVDALPAIADRLGDAQPLPVDHVARIAIDAAIEPERRLLTTADIANA
ncbi:MAG: NAD-dependent epimerase/dehydratase family protein [Halobacteriota archaeon]